MLFNPDYKKEQKSVLVPFYCYFSFHHFLFLELFFAKPTPMATLFWKHVVYNSFCFKCILSSAALIQHNNSIYWMVLWLCVLTVPIHPFFFRERQGLEESLPQVLLTEAHLIANAQRCVKTATSSKLLVITVLQWQILNVIVMCLYSPANWKPIFRAEVASIRKRLRSTLADKREFTHDVAVSWYFRSIFTTRIGQTHPYGRNCLGFQQDESIWYDYSLLDGWLAVWEQLS